MKFLSVSLLAATLLLTGLSSSSPGALASYEDGMDGFPPPALNPVARGVFLDTNCSNSRMRLHIRVTTASETSTPVTAWAVHVGAARTKVHYGPIHIDNSLIRLRSEDSESSIYYAVDTLQYNGPEFKRTQTLHCRPVAHPTPEW